jgi:hypothetical protein
MIRVTRRPIRPKPLTPIPVAMVMVASLEAELLRALPVKLSGGDHRYVSTIPFYKSNLNRTNYQ